MIEPMTEAAIREALSEVIDPELGLNIVELGLVYGIEIDGARVVIDMTMTSPACPLGDYLRDMVDSTVRRRVRDVEAVDVRFVWEPPWNPDMMAESAREHFNR